MGTPVKTRAMAYITHGNRLLVFRQPAFPEAGIQVPGGTVEPDESLETAVLREAFEETGLECLKLVSYLGDSFFDRATRGDVGIQHRQYFHLLADGDVEESWEHWERHPSEGDVPEILFSFNWVSLPDGVPPLIVGMDEKVPVLLERMGLERHSQG